MLTNFTTEFYQDGQTQPVRDLSRISTRYLKNGFIYDLIPLLPLPFIAGPMTRVGKLIYLLKLFRLQRGLHAFNVGFATDAIRNKIR
jgi:hypothetical protein